MAYTRQDWNDAEDNNPSRYLIDGVPQEVVKDITGQTTAGSPVNASRMGHIEDGIFGAAQVADSASSSANNANTKANDLEEISTINVNVRSLEITRPSFTFGNNKKIEVELEADVAAGGNLTVQVNTDTALNLQDSVGVNLTELDAGYYTFIAKAGSPNFFVLAPSSGATILANENNFEIETGVVIETGQLLFINSDNKLELGSRSNVEMSGVETTAASGSSFDAKIFEINNTHNLLVYQEGTVSQGDLRARVVRLNADRTLSLGSITVLDPNLAVRRGIDGALIDTNKLIVTYAFNNDSRAIVVIISSLSITAGTLIDTGSIADSGTSGVCRLDTNKALLVGEQSGVGRCNVMTIVGTTITLNNNFVFSATVAGQKMIPVADGVDRAVVLYVNGSNHGQATLLTISGTTITTHNTIVIQAFTIGTINGSLIKPGLVAGITSNVSFLITASLTSIALTDTSNFTVGNIQSSLWTTTLNDNILVALVEVLNDYQTSQFEVTDTTIEQTTLVRIATSTNVQRAAISKFGSSDFIASYSVDSTSVRLQLGEAPYIVNAISKGNGVATETIPVYDLRSEFLG